MSYMGIDVSELLSCQKDLAEKLRREANLPSATVYTTTDNVRVQTRAHADGKIVHTITVEKTTA